MGRIEAPHPPSILGARIYAERAGGIYPRTLRIQTNVRILHYLLSPYLKLLSWNRSKKQLTRRISSWGLGKNIKRSDRKTIIEGVRSELEPKAASFETRELRGRRLDKAKFKRWMRKESAIPARSEHEIAWVEKPYSMSAWHICTRKELSLTLLLQLLIMAWITPLGTISTHRSLTY